MLQVAYATPMTYAVGMVMLPSDNCLATSVLTHNVVGKHIINRKQYQLA